MQSRTAIAAISIIVLAACHARQAPSRLTNGQATIAMRSLIGLDRFQAVLGTCKPAAHAEYKGQTACTVLAVSPGGTSETQADFHWDGTRWVAAPSGSQAVLPFPDPALMDIHAGARIDPDAGPLR